MTTTTFWTPESRRRAAALTRIKAAVRAHVAERDQLYADLREAAKHGRALSLPSSVILRLLDDIETAQQERDLATKLQHRAMDESRRCTAELRARLPLWRATE